MQKLQQSSIGKLVRNYRGFILIQCAVRKESYPRRKGSGHVFLLVHHWKKTPFNWDPKLLKAFEDKGARTFSEKDWRQYIYERSNKTSFEYCKSSKHSLVCIRAIQEHTGNMIALKLMGHVAIPCNWKEFVFHRGCSFNINSILETGLIAGGRESKEGRQTIFFTHLNPFGENPDE